MSSLRVGLALVWGIALLGGLSAAESNAIQYDGGVTYDECENSVPMYLTSGTLTFPLDWDSTLVPRGATKAVLIVRSKERSSNAPARTFDLLYPAQAVTAVRPATSVSCTLFDGEVPPRDAAIRVSLNFVTEDNSATNSAFLAWFQLTAGSFGAARILTVSKDSQRWKTLPNPADIHFDASWFGAAPTYASVSNLAEGVYHQGLSPLNGPASQIGVVPVDSQTTGPGNRKIFRIFAGNTKLTEIAFQGGGSIVIIR